MNFPLSIRDALLSRSFFGRGFHPLARFGPSVDVLGLGARRGVLREEESADAEGEKESCNQDEHNDREQQRAGGGDGMLAVLVAFLLGPEEGAAGGENVVVAECDQADRKGEKEGQDGPLGAGGAMRSTMKAA